MLSPSQIESCNWTIFILVSNAVDPLFPKKDRWKSRGKLPVVQMNQNIIICSHITISTILTRKLLFDLKTPFI